MEKVDLKNFTLEELEAFILGCGKERFRAKQIFKWIYQKQISDFSLMTNLSKEFREQIASRAVIGELHPEEVETGADGTRKYLFRLADGTCVESVLIPEEDRNTLCISSQVGCAMACRFCLTGTFSLTRNLTAAEIVNQVCAVKREKEIRNIVFMGMGEPLHNLDNVIRAITILGAADGLQLSNRRVTVSTSGLIPELERLAETVIVNLAISLNATTNEQRDLLMPINRTYPIERLLEACRRLPLPGRRKITFEYVLIKGINDSLDDARRLVRLLSGIPTKINLISFNEHEGCEFQAPGQESIDRFHSYLLSKHFTVITRSSRGSDISAACGQLRGKLEKREARGGHDTLATGNGAT
jgi:23S rRNA (adenine2503-C2)-methyltransferase